MIGFGRFFPSALPAGGDTILGVAFTIVILVGLAALLGPEALGLDPSRQNLLSIYSGPSKQAASISIPAIRVPRSAVIRPGSVEPAFLMEVPSTNEAALICFSAATQRPCPIATTSSSTERPDLRHR